jgi:TM2 domain-containing membrane protein YozV
MVYSEKQGLVVLLLAFFLGGLGVHSFYVGKTGVGVAQLLTLGGFGIWVLIDIIMLVTGTYKDSEGKVVKL